MATNRGSAPEHGNAPHAAGDLSKGVKNLPVTARRITIAQGAWRHAAMREHRTLGTKPARPTRPGSRSEGRSLFEAVYARARASVFARLSVCHNWEFSLSPRIRDPCHLPVAVMSA